MEFLQPLLDLLCTPQQDHHQYQHTLWMPWTDLETDQYRHLIQAPDSFANNNITTMMQASVRSPIQVPNVCSPQHMRTFLGQFQPLPVDWAGQLGRACANISTSSDTSYLRRYAFPLEASPLHSTPSANLAGFGSVNHESEWEQNFFRQALCVTAFLICESIDFEKPSPSGCGALDIVSGVVIYHNTAGDVPAEAQHFLPGEIQSAMMMLIYKSTVADHFTQQKRRFKSERSFSRAC